MQRWRLFLLTFSTLAATTFCSLASAGPYDVVRVETVKTSIYVGHVTLTTSLFKRTAGIYATEYKARVFPYFFYNEGGHLWIEFSDDQLAQLAKGETVQFKGRAESDDKESRRVEGRAAPLDANSGKLKVRVFVSPKIELIFNTIYHFEKG